LMDNHRINQSRRRVVHVPLRSRPGSTVECLPLRDRCGAQLATELLAGLCGDRLRFIEVAASACRPQRPGPRVDTGGCLRRESGIVYIDGQPAGQQLLRTTAPATDALSIGMM
jgi:hypothetical protein